ncbi:MAG: hypothetical protein ACPGSD_17360 [Flavobacteriales bacterium]
MNVTVSITKQGDLNLNVKNANSVKDSLFVTTLVQKLFQKNISKSGDKN